MEQFVVPLISSIAEADINLVSAGPASENEPRGWLRYSYATLC